MIRPVISAFGDAREPEDGQVGDALAGAGLADDAQGLALADSKETPSTALTIAVVGVEVDLEVLDLDQRLAHW